MSLLEVTMVMIVIGIVSTAAAISYQLFAARADDISAIAVLRYVLVTEQSMYQNLGQFSDDPALLATYEPSISYTTGVSNGAEVVSVKVEPYTLPVAEGGATVDAVSMAALQGDTCLVAVQLAPGVSTEPQRSGRYTITGPGTATESCLASLAHDYLGVEAWHNTGPN